MESPKPVPVLVLCRDLLFGSKITSAASASGVPVQMIRDVSKIPADSPSRRLIVDLTQDGYLQAAAEWKQKTAGQVTGFAGHADTQTLAAARQAGIDRILTRGEFAANVAAILRGG